MGIQSYKFVSLSVLGQRMRDVEICNLAGSITDVVRNLAPKAGIRVLFQSQGWGRCVHEEQRCLIPLLLIQ